MSNFGSKIIAGLEATYEVIRARHEELGPAVFVTGTGRNGRGLNYGHYAKNRWKVGEDAVPEIFVGGERLEGGAEATLETILHEAAHYLAAIRGIKDVSSGQYHNKEFKKVAEEVGLCQAEPKHRGFSNTEITEETRIHYKAALEALAEILEGYIPPSRARKGPDRNLSVATCGCEPVRKLRISPKQFDAGAIMCGVCGYDFQLDN